MKSILHVLGFCMLLASMVLANGVGVVNTVEGLYLKLQSSEVLVQVENQVAVITATQTFKAEHGDCNGFKYAFPLAEEESAISLRWYMNQSWQEAVIEPSPQDTTLPGGGGGGENWALETYLGETPLFFQIEDELPQDSLVIMELTYVNLLPYQMGQVSFTYPNDYSLIQSDPLIFQELEFNINSERNIDNISLLSHTADVSWNEGNQAQVIWMGEAIPANANYRVQYSLSLEELGLFGLSTMLDPGQVPDEGDPGFFVFVAEPDPGNSSEVIDKVFTLIVDRSGSMGGNKIVQARGAASFIVEHLNEGDLFNIVDFSSSVLSFRPEHVEFNAANQTAALDYIASFQAGGGTNIAGAFGVAIPQFAAADEGTANIIIFFTDGEATSGITSTEGILNHVQDLVLTYETEPTIFTFGIGDYVNEQLLTLLANQNNGLATFLGNGELETAITNFYLLIRNPVLLNTSMSFTPDILSEAYPFPLPNLYKGQQMIVAGRYAEAGTVEIQLNGIAFSQPVSYVYPLTLADTANPSYQFLPKIWAKKKIENLLVQYYIQEPDSPEAESIRAAIVELSVQFGVITPFTSFAVPTGVEEFDEGEPTSPDSYVLLENYPNPFNGGTNIRFQVNSELHKDVTIMIYNSLGQLVKILTVQVSGTGSYEVFWDGTLADGDLAPSGVYVYLVDFGNTLLGGKMTLIK